MAKYVVRVARSAGLIILFIIAAVARHRDRRDLRVRRRPSADLRARRLRAEHDLARLRLARRGRRRVRDPAPRGHPVRGDFAEAEAGDHRRRGLRVRAALRPQHPPHRHRRSLQGHHRAAQGRRRQHADAAARAQAVPDRRKDVGAQDQGSAARDPDREALHEARDLHALLQPDVLRPRRLRRRGGVAAVLRQAGQGPDARGGGAHRRHPPGQRAPEPVRQHGCGAAAPQLHARPDGGGRLHHARPRRRTRRRSRSPFAASRRPRPPSRRTSSKRCARSSRAATAPSSCTRTGSRSRPRSTSSCRRRPTARSTRGSAASTSRRGFRKPRRNVLAEGHAIDDVPTSALGPSDEGIATSSRPSSPTPTAPTIELRAGSLPGHRRSKGLRLDGQDAPRHSSCSGDLVEARLVDRSTSSAHTATGTLEQPPLVEGAVLAIDNRTGQIKAMVGGFSFERSKFNRATQASRQVGSAFKPIVYTAAIDRGYTPTTTIMDVPATFPGGAGSATVHAAQLRPQVRGADHAAARARGIAQHPGGAGDGAARARAGDRLRAPARPRIADSAVPARWPWAPAEATLTGNDERVFRRSRTRASGCSPYSILKVADREGNLLEENRPEPKDAIRADTAFVMTNLLRGVVQRGTAGEGRGAQLADRREDRNDRRLHRRVVHRLRSGHHPGRVGRARSEEAASATTRPAPRRRCRSGSTS